MKKLYEYTKAFVITLWEDIKTFAKKLTEDIVSFWNDFKNYIKENS